MPDLVSIDRYEMCPFLLLLHYYMEYEYFLKI